MIKNYLTKAVDASSLAAFRIFFGAIMAWGVLRYVYYDRIATYYIEPIFWFPYPFLPFIKPLPGLGMYLVFLIMGGSALGIALGFYFRLSAILFTLTYTYVFLLDQAQYNNHYYLICLVGFLLCFTNAERRFSIDRWRLQDRLPGWVPVWQPLILRIQFFLVYFFGGIAKINEDWLQAKPMDMWLSDRAHYPLVGPFFETEMGAYFFSYGGLFFDLFIGFILWHRHLRPLGFVGVLFFHLTNKWLFSIGVFPYTMIAATVLFCEFDWPRGLLKQVGLQYRKPLTPILPNRIVDMSRLGMCCIVFFLLVQILIPMRHVLYPNYVSWTEEGHNFAWHMKLRDKDGRVNFIAQDKVSQFMWHVDLTDFLTDRQIGKMEDRPVMLLQFAQFLAAYYRQVNGRDVAIYVDSWASLNGRPYQRLVDGSRDLGNTSLDFITPADWILKLDSGEELD